MSNFDFMNQSDYLRFPTCKVLFENALLAENAYFSDHEKCALKIRFVLEQFCIFVSEIKNANYPDDQTPFALGKYWNPQNRFEFLRTFGNRNVTLIKRTNMISCSFLHSEIPTREDIFPEMLRNVYILLLWLYKELGLKTALSERDYSIGKIPKEHVEDSREGAMEPVYSSDQLLKKLKNYFPECNTDKLCNIEVAGNKYIVKNLAGEKIDELPSPEMLDYSQEEANKLKAQLAEIKKDFDRKTREFVQNIGASDSRIRALEDQLADTESANDRQKQELQQEIRNIKREKDETSVRYRQKLSELGNEYDELKDKYDAMTPIKLKYADMQKQMKSLLKERTDMETRFDQTQKDLIREVGDTTKRLQEAKKNIGSLNALAHEKNVLIGQLEKELLEKEKLLEDVKTKAAEEYKRAQTASAETIEHYKGKFQHMETMLTQIMSENIRFRETLSKLNHVEETKGYLQVINEGILKIKETNAVYAENPDERRLREYLLQVKAHYESQIEELNDQLAQREEELEWQKRKYEELLNSLDSVNRDSEKPQPQGRDASVQESAKRDKPSQDSSEREKAVQVSPLAGKRPRLWIGLATAIVGLVVIVAVVVINGKGTSEQRRSYTVESMPDTAVGTVQQSMQGIVTEIPQQGMQESATEIAQQSMPETATGISQESVPENVQDQMTPQNTISETKNNTETEIETQMESGRETERQTEAETETGSNFQDQKLEQLIQDTDASRPMTSYRQIKGINEKLLEEIDGLDIKAIAAVAQMGERAKRENVSYIGNAKVPILNRYGSVEHMLLGITGLSDGLSLCGISNCEVIKFAYVSEKDYGYVMLAVDIADFCDSLDENSTLEDVNALLGNNYNKSVILNSPTDFASAQQETGYLYQFRNPEEDSGKTYTGVIFLFDETGKICDYVYMAVDYYPY